MVYMAVAEGWDLCPLEKTVVTVRKACGHLCQWLLARAVRWALERLVVPQGSIAAGYPEKPSPLLLNVAGKRREMSPQGSVTWGSWKDTLMTYGPLAPRTPRSLFASCCLASQP